MTVAFVAASAGTFAYLFDWWRWRRPSTGPRRRATPLQHAAGGPGRPTP